MIGLLIALVVLLLLPGVWFIATYNALIKLRNFCNESWSGIDTELKRRYDLIPNLVETVKAYAKHERETLEQVTRARNTAVASTGSPQSQARDENQLIHGLDKLFAVAEAYPDLKADRHFLELQQELARTENRIARARRFYNANVRELNTRTEVFPSNIVAGLFNFRGREYFDIDDPVQRGPVAVSIN
ncbi:MAG: LemA family protein [Phycisphaeraceae bacterium]|nr:LemA family protein [Phycisphaeraceae bacterium]